MLMDPSASLDTNAVFYIRFELMRALSQEAMSAVCWDHARHDQ